MDTDKLPFIFTRHLRDRYQERILGYKLGEMRSLDSKIAKDIHEAKENMQYLSIPRYVLFLYEKYGAIDGLRIFESEHVTFVTKRDKGEGFRRVLTCWKRDPNNEYFTKFFNTALTNQEIYTRIAVFKSKRRK